MTVARWTLVSAIGMGAATACFLPGIDPTTTAGNGAAGSGGGASGGAGTGATGGGADCTAGTPADTQVDGDCQVAVCDGEGSTTSEPDDADTPDDGGEPCIVASCVDGQPLLEDEPDGTECGVDLACQNGVCAGCLTAGDCGTPDECTHFECNNPGPAGVCTIVNDDLGASCGTGPTCTTEAELTNYACDGGGSCAETTTLCEPYACSGNACTAGCTASFGCAPGAGCTAGFCQDCQTCNEWYFLTDMPPVCNLGMTFAQLLYDCGCTGAAPCATVCTGSLCNSLSPQGDDDCAACLGQSCPTQLNVCLGDADPFP